GPAPHSAVDPGTLLNLQRVAGNEAVGQALGRPVLTVQRASLAESGIQDDFQGGLRAALQRWSTMKPLDRAAALQDVINGQLKVVGAPAITVVALKVGGDLTD